MSGASSLPSARQIWRVRDVLEWTVGYFERAQLDSARLDAEVLLADVLRLDRVGLYCAYDRPVDAGERTLFRDRVRRRAEGEPVQYIRGQQEFWSLAFEVAPGVLIPRPETERLVELALERLPHDQPARVVDVGTGSGCIAVALAHERPLLQLVAIEPSEAARAIAARNLQRHEVEDRVELNDGDLLRGVVGPFDLVISNPPYIARPALAELPRTIRDHEPQSALDGGDDGLVLVRRLVSQAAGVLAAGGWLLVEIGADQGPAARTIAEGCSQLVDVAVAHDLAGRDRVLLARRK